MGRIFTPEQLEAGRIPQAGDNELAARYILYSLFEDPSDQSLVRSALVYGSVAMGQADVRSDIDLLVNHPDTRIVDSAEHVGTIISEAESMYAVAVEPQLYEVGRFLIPQTNGMDPFYAAHLLEVQQLENPSWHVNSPVDELTFEEVSSISPQQVREVSYRYLAGKSRHFVKALLSTERTINYHVLQRAFELPSAIGRKILPVFYDLDQVPKPGNKSAMKDMLREVTDRIAEKPPALLAAFNRLDQLDSDYSRLLWDVRNDEMSLGDYEYWISDNYKRALKLAVFISSSWARELLRQMP